MKNKRLNSKKKHPLGEARPSPSSNGLEQSRLSAKQLREKVHRLEVELAAVPRLAKERQRGNFNTLPPPDMEVRRQVRSALTHAQIQAGRRRQLFQLAEFAFTFILLAGMAAWAVKAWQTWAH